MTKFAWFCMFGVLGLCAQESDRPTSFHVKLRTPVGTETSRVGATISASVISPETYLGGKLEGAVDEVSGGSPAKLRVTFRVLEFKGKRQSIASTTVSFVNSKGHPGVDDGERPLKLDNGVFTRPEGSFVLDDGAELRLQVTRR